MSHDHASAEERFRCLYVKHGAKPQVLTNPPPLTIRAQR
jgi:hypothetical protein